MNLKELRREVHELPNIDLNIKKFRENWVNNSLISELNKKQQKEVQIKLIKFNQKLNQLKSSQILNEKLKHYARSLIDLKLTQFSEDYKKADMITNQMLNDDFYRIQNTIGEIKTFEQEVSNLESEYDHISLILQQHLSLDNYLKFNELKHSLHFTKLLSLPNKQKHLVRHLGQNFVSLARKNKNLRNKK